jgi:hypothetical protein
MVDWLAARVAELDEEDLTWGVASRKITPAASEGDQPSVVVEQRARVHALVLMLRDERLLMGKLAESAHRCGIEDRMMRQRELEGELIAKVVRAILGDPQLGLSREQWAAVAHVVPRHLRAMDQVA